MRKRHQANLALLFAAAEALGPLREHVVFCGGIVTDILITDRAAPEVLGTTDVDVIVEASSLTQYAAMQSEMRKLGFKHDLSKDAPACRFVFGELQLDFMPTDGSLFGWVTTFYPAAVKGAVVDAASFGEASLTIRIISAPLFIATKLEAFSERGAGNYERSKDMADIVAVVDGRVELEGELLTADMQAQTYVRRKFAAMLDDEAFHDSLSYLALESRIGTIVDRMTRIASS